MAPPVITARGPQTAALTVLYDAQCPMCTRFRDWLEEQPRLIRLDLVAAGSAEARRRFPSLDHARTLREITVVGDTGAVWTGEYAWVMCLWATGSHRAAAERLATPAWLPFARGAACTAAGLRGLLRRDEYPGGGGYPDGCAGSCAPLAEG